MQQLEDDIAQIRVERKELAEKILAAQAAVARSTENLQANERALAKVMSQVRKKINFFFPQFNFFFSFLLIARKVHGRTGQRADPCTARGQSAQN